MCGGVFYYYYYYYCRCLALVSQRPIAPEREGATLCLWDLQEVGWEQTQRPLGSKCRAGAMLRSCTAFTPLLRAVSGASEHFLRHLLTYLSLRCGAVAGVCSITLVVVCGGQ